MRNQILSAAALMGAVMTFAAPMSAQAACQQFTANNKAHVTAARAVACGSYNMYACAKGSNQNLGLNNVYTTTTLKEEPAGYFAKGTCPISTGSKPVVESWQLGAGGNSLSASNVIVTDTDSDLTSLKLRITNQRTGAVDQVNCAFAAGGAPTQYVANSCEIYNGAVWGKLKVEPVAQDAQGNVGVGVAETVNFLTGSSAPSVDSANHTWIGSVLKITGTVSDLDGDLVSVWMGNPANGGVVCQGTYSYTCTFDYSGTGIPAGTTFETYIVATDSVENSDAMSVYPIVMPDVSTSCVSATNANHVTAGRAVVQYVNLHYAKGSNDYLGLAATTTMLKEISSGTWKKVVSCN